MLLLKLVEVGPSVSEVRVYLDGPLEPLATFAHLSLRPEQSEREGGRGRGGEGGREGGREEGEGGRKGGREGGGEKQLSGKS